MRYSYLLFILLLHGFFAQAQIINPGDQPVNLPTLERCIREPELIISPQFMDQLFDITQTGTPFGNAVGYDYVLLRSSDCEPPDDMVIELFKTGECDTEFSHGITRLFHAEVLLGGQEIASRDLNGIGPEVISIPHEQLRLEQLGFVPQVISLDLRLVETIVTPNSVYENDHFYHLSDLLVVDVGSELYFSHEELEGHTFYDICNTHALGGSDPILNCNPDTSITVNLQMTNFSSNAITNSFSIGYNFVASVGYGSGNPDYSTQGNLQYDASISGDAEQTTVFEDEEIYSNAVTMNMSLVLPPRSADGCSFIGLTFAGRPSYIQSYTVGCTELVAGEIYDENITFYSVQPIVCTAQEEISSECMPAVLHYNAIRGGNFASNDDRSPNDDCTLSIYTTQEPEPTYMQTFLWEGPGGFVATGSELENVPFGTYTLTIYDECGSETEYTIDPCEGGVSTSEWVFNENTSQLCRTVSCSGGEDCAGSTYQECIDVEFSDWEYDAISGTACRTLACPEGETCDVEQQCVDVTFAAWDYYDNGLQTICTRDVLAQDDVVATEEHPAQLSYDFDPILEQCFQYVRCGAPTDINPELVETNRAEPVYEAWDFDEFTEVCVREVRCFELSAQEVATDLDIELENPFNTEWEDENIEPQYGWEYQDGWGCTGYVFCDPFEAPVHPSNTDWELNWGQGEPVFTSVDYDNEFGVISCILDVECQFNGVLYETPALYPPLSSDPIEASSATFIGSPTNVGYCEFVYQCGDLPPEIVATPFDAELVETDANGTEWCEAFCRGFRETTSQGRFRCSELTTLLEQEQYLLELGQSKSLSYGWETDEQSLTNKPATKVAPNPFLNSIRLENIPNRNHEVQIVLLGADGREALRRKVLSTPTVSLDTRELVEGLYVLLILGENDEILYKRRLVKVARP